MSPEATSIPVRPEAATLQEIDDLLDEVARLARSNISPQEFHREVLDRAVRALSAVGGAVWTRAATGTWQVDSGVDLTGNRLVEALASQAAHGELLDAVIDSSAGRIVLPHALAAGGPSPNPTDFLLVVCPLALAADGMLAAALEVVQRPGGSPSSHQGYLRLLEALCELAADFHRQRRLRVLEALVKNSQRVEQFSLGAHGSLDLTATACAIVNEGRRLIECDRVSVAVRHGHSFRLWAVSGLETLDRRANLVRRLEELVLAVVAAGEPVWFAGETDQLAPEIAEPLHAWQDESHARSLAIIPLRTTASANTRENKLSASGAAFGAALVAERFAGDLPDEAYRNRISTACRHAELALQNALEHESLPFFPLLHALKDARWFVEVRRLPKTLAIAGLILLTIVALVFVPADFEIEGRGVLQPRNRRDVFAQTDGIVSEVRTEHARECRAGEVLVVMTKSQLDFDWSRVSGEAQTARQRLASVKAARLDLRPQTTADREKYNQLTVEEEEVSELLRSLEKQHEVLKAQRDELSVRSPLDGQVVTWNVAQALEARPVQRGQVLLQVADLSGPWILDLEIPDDRIGHMLEAQQKLHSALDVSFMLATEPGTTYRGIIESVALATDVRPPETATVQVTVDIDRSQIKGLRPNATVVSRIHCGRRSIGFVWFHSFWELIQKKVLF